MSSDDKLALRLLLLRQFRSQGNEAALPLDSMLRSVNAELKTAAESSLYAFVRLAWSVLEPGKPFIGGWHIEAICEHLEAVSRGDIKRLVITIPPRCSKSSVVCVLWPCWDWIKMPSRQWLCLAHSDDNAVRDTRRMRMVVQSEWYQSLWPLTFARDENKKSSFQNDAMGQRIGVGILSQFQGVNADVEIFDDPVDNKQVQSHVKMEAALTTYREQALTRLNTSEGAIVAIGQRLAVKDFIGYLIESGYDVLNIPMRFERNHPFPTTTGWKDPRTREGELICPNRFPEKYVKQQELPHNLGAFGVESQFQQRPIVRGGSTLRREWFAIVDAAPRRALRCRYWDTAGTDDSGCHTVGVRMSVADGVFFIEHVVRRQVSFHKRHKLMKSTAMMDAEIDQTTEQVIERQGGSGGKEAAMHEVRLLAGLPVYIDNPAGKGDKDQRLIPFAAQAEAGNVKIVKGSWNAEYLDALEMIRIGSTQGRDDGDATAGGFNWLTRDGGVTDSASYELLASGNEQDSQPFSDEEVGQLPDFLRDLISETSRLADDRLNN